MDRDNTNTTNGVTINTATSGGPISIGHSTSETTVNDNLTVAGTSTLTGNTTVTGTLSVAGGYGSTGVSVSAGGNIQANGTLTVDGVSTLTGVTTFSNKIIINSSAEDGGDGVAIPLTNHATFIQTGGAETSTLGAGTEGQIKVIVMETDAGDMVTTVTNAAWGGSGVITFDAIGDAVTLQYIDSKWYCIGNNGAVFG